MKYVTRVATILKPQFSCELKAALTRGEVEERLRGSLRTGLLRDRIGHPFIGTVGAAEFKIALDTGGEDSPAYVSGHIEESDGVSRITIFAKTGIFNTVGTFVLGISLCMAIALYFDLGMPASVFLAFIGGALLDVLIFRVTVRQFWEELDDTLVNLLFVLEASIIWRSHDRYGLKISHPNQMPRQE